MGTLPKLHDYFSRCPSTGSKVKYSIVQIPGQTGPDGCEKACGALVGGWRWIILALICSKPICRMTPSVAPSKFSALQLEYVSVQGPAGAGREKGVPPMGPNKPTALLQSAELPGTALFTANKALHRPPLHPPLLSFNHPTTRLHLNSIANNLQHRYQYTSLNMPAQIAQPLPTQQMTASTPADAPRAVDEQPVSLTPHNNQPTNQPTTRTAINTPPLYPTRCLITWPLGTIMSAKLSHTIPALCFRQG